ncbi:MAG: polysaccharide deacetylase family protein [Bacteroidales bacterium]|nr:polysaccharide deacetylase family protein [Bacteroidales bacterium]
MKIFNYWLTAFYIFLTVALASIATACTGKANASWFSATPDDTVAPTLTTRGPMMIMEGEGHDSTFLTRGVKYSDNSGAARLSIDSSHIDWNRPGIYDVVYSVNDSTQNATTVTEQLRVVGRNEKIIYLTFDDGPSVCTDQILSILRQENVKATFFVTAQFSQYTSRMADIARDGHELAIHSYSHNFAIYKSIESYFEDLNKINDLIEKYSGHRSRILRHPGGSSNSVYRKHNSDPRFMDRLCVALLDSGYQFVDWNLDSRDASGNNVPVARLVSSACSARHNIECLLMHDTGAKRTTVQALPQIIRYFKAQGYEFGVLNSVDYVCWHGGKQKAARLKALKGKDAASIPSPAKVEKKPQKPATNAPDTTKPAPAKPAEPKQVTEVKHPAEPKQATEVKKPAEPQKSAEPKKPVESKKSPEHKNATEHKAPVAAVSHPDSASR